MHVVTGASSGIGRGVAIALAERGEPVLAVGRDLGRLIEVERVAPDLVTTVAADLATTDGLGSVVDTVDDRPVPSWHVGHSVPPG